MAKIGKIINATDIRGSIAGTTFGRTRSGGILRVKAAPLHRKSAGQSKIRELFREAGSIASQLSGSNFALWKAYTLGTTRRNAISGTTYWPTVVQAITELYVPFKLGSPTGSFPLQPPSTPFLGDLFHMTVSGNANSITWTADAINQTGIATMFYIQKLNSQNCAPKHDKYVCALVFSISNAGTKQKSVNGLHKGWYACADKQLLLATGQTTPMITRGIAFVPNN